MLLGKILADDPDDLHRSKKTRSQGKVRGRTSQNALRGAKGRLDRIKRDCADDQDTHRYLPIMGFSLTRMPLGMRARSVMIAFLSDTAQSQDRPSDKVIATRRIVLCANSTFCCNSFKT